jgi:hypothetical protein
MPHQSWSDLTPQQRRGVTAAGVAQVALFLAAVVSIHRTPEERVRGRKGGWYALSLVNWVGPIAWFAVGRRRGRSRPPS